MRIAIAIPILVMLAGCERNLLSGIPDAPVDALDGCPTPSLPLMPGAHLLYLNTEGVTLEKGTPDSLTNTTDLIAGSSVVVPPFLDGRTGRQTFIDEIVQTAQGALAPYSIDIVTTRPVGSYYMFVLGGDPVKISGAAANVSGVTDLSCDIQPGNSVDLMFDEGTRNTPVSFYASELLGALAHLQGLATGQDSDNDCMCNSGATWFQASALCTFGGSEPVTSISALSCGRTMQDEPAMLAAALGCR